MKTHAKPLKILYLAAEVYPFVKVGGLADVAGSLPKALKKLDCDIRVAMPKYRGLFLGKHECQDLNVHPTVATGDGYYFPKIGMSHLPNSDVPIYFIDEPHFFDRKGIYAHKDDPKRFCYFAKATLEMCKSLNFKPDIIHINDWQCSFVPVFLKSIYASDPFFENTKTLLTIHNIQYQGNSGPKLLDFAQIPPSARDSLIIDLQDGDINFLYEAILNADYINTVSKEYAKEILRPEFGRGMEGILQKNKKVLSGILNGINYEVWDPESDDIIAKKYSLRNIGKKEVNKTALQNELGLSEDTDLPLFGMVTRLADQKGFELVESIKEKLMELDFQLVVLGIGDQKVEKVLSKLQEQYPDRVAFINAFSENMAHKVYAGSDFLLMPSKFEPCGLSQMFAMRYGTIPIVHRTGGLAESVESIKTKPISGEGFTFCCYTKQALYNAVKKAIDTFPNKKFIEKIRINCMKKDLSWKKSAGEYRELYEIILN